MIQLRTIHPRFSLCFVRESKPWKLPWDCLQFCFSPGAACGNRTHTLSLEGWCANRYANAAYGGDGGSWTRVQSIHPKNFLRVQPCMDFRQSLLHCKRRLTIPWYSYTTGKSYKRLSVFMMPNFKPTDEFESTRVAYAACAIGVLVLAFLFNECFLRGAPPRLAYLCSLSLSKPLHPHIGVSWRTRTFIILGVNYPRLKHVGFSSAGFLLHRWQLRNTEYSEWNRHNMTSGCSLHRTLRSPFQRDGID